MEIVKEPTGETISPSEHVFQSKQDEMRNIDDKTEESDEIIKFLLEEGSITSEQLDYARKIHAKLETKKRFIELLQSLNYLTRDQIKAVLKKKRAIVSLGTLLVELGYVEEENLKKILQIQQESKEKKKIGELLIEYNYISESELIEAISLHLGYPYVEPDVSKIDATLLSKVSPSYLKKYLFIPVERGSKGVTIVLNDPNNEKAIETARSLYATNIQVALATKQQITEAIEKYEKRLLRQETKDDTKGKVVRLVDELLRAAVDEDVSDIHIEPLRRHLRIRVRKDGSLQHYSDLPLDMAPVISSRIKVMAKADISEKRRHQDGRILLGSDDADAQIDIRCSFYVTVFGEKIVMRILNKKEELLDLKELGLRPKTLERYKTDALDLPTGVVIITGPTGVGKTTTLYSSVHHCNDPSISIVTAEDPVEYVMDGISQCSMNPKIGLTFEESLKQIVRQDPDIIVLGEIRDKFSAETAIQAALTGHKVYTTFHTEDSIGGLLRLMNMEIESFLIASTVVCVLAQRLLRKICKNCKTVYEPEVTELRRLGYRPEDVRGFSFSKGKGCGSCNYTGYKGRVGIFELLILDDHVREAVLRKMTAHEIRKISTENAGLVSLTEDGIAKAVEGTTTISEVLKKLPRLMRPRPIKQIVQLTGVQPS